MEPRFSLPPETPLSSKKELVIGGVRIYVYGLDELNEGPEIAILYLAHNRTRTYRVTEGIAHEVLFRYRSQATRTRAQLIAVTMNMRNHGDREVTMIGLFGTNYYNATIITALIPGLFRSLFRQIEHGKMAMKITRAYSLLSNMTQRLIINSMDLLSMISGSAQDFKLVADYLPAYLPRATRVYNIMAGVSLGGHAAWRIASLAYPGQFHAFAMIVGSPDLSSLLLDRLGVDVQSLDQQGDDDGVSYEQLYRLMNAQQRRRWPPAIHELVREGDRKVATEFPTNVPILLCNGKYDQLVPAKYTASWVGKRKHLKNIKFFVQDNTGHSCTKEMVAMVADWLGDIFQSKSTTL